MRNVELRLRKVDHLQKGLLSTRQGRHTSDFKKRVRGVLKRAQCPHGVVYRCYVRESAELSTCAKASQDICLLGPRRYADWYESLLELVERAPPQLDATLTRMIRTSHTMPSGRISRRYHRLFWCGRHDDPTVSSTGRHRHGRSTPSFSWCHVSLLDSCSIRSDRQGGIPIRCNWRHCCAS